MSASPLPPVSFGIAPTSLAKLRRVFDATPGLQRVSIFGSRARGSAREESDIDLAVEGAGWTFADLAQLTSRIAALGLLYKTDAVLLDDTLDAALRARIERDRQVLWEPAARRAEAQLAGPAELKDFQRRVLRALAGWLDELQRQRTATEAASNALRAMEGMEEQLSSLEDFPAKAWAALARDGALPAPLKGQSPGYQSRWSGAAQAVPNVCFKVPTGGGKTLLAAAAIGQVMQSYLHRHTGLVLWVVPNEAIYTQTLKALKNVDHPYRQLLAVAGAGRVKVLEKMSPLTRHDVDSHLCVMLLMLQAAARTSNETLKVFRDRGNVLGFVPREDDIDAHWELLRQVPNLDAYRSLGQSVDEARANKGSVVKSSLCNALRLLRPLVVIDEGQKAYSEIALKTLDGFNPAFMLELSATPRLASAKGPGSNILVNVRGTDLDAEEMIKLPIQVDARGWSEWQSCLTAALAQLDALQTEADALHGETARYIRPILLVQVERTGADTRDAGFIHADDAKAHLLRLGLQERQVAIKTSERNDLAAPENIDLLSPSCAVRVIITKQALQEGWDCPFAYVLCALAAGRNLNAMTQLVGRILRQPQAAKTGRAGLDACWVLCHDARTGDVVKAIKQSLEGEGLGDLGINVRTDGASGGPASEKRMVDHQRRPPWQGVRLFLPTVSWVEHDGRRRPLDYDSDVLAQVAWEDVDASSIAADWAPDAQASAATRVSIGLDVLTGAAPARVDSPDWNAGADELNTGRLLRALSDVAPNPWWAWAWLEQVRTQLRERGFADAAVARSAVSLAERLRHGIQTECDRLAEAAFRALLTAGRIEFRLRADAADYELPEHFSTPNDAPAALLRESDGQPVHKSLFVPALRTADLNDFECKVAGYLDEQQAVGWWHRNVARRQTSLQGWRRDKFYPDFVFAIGTSEGGRRIVLLETKGAHLKNDDTRYKTAVMDALNAAYRDERFTRVGSLALEGGSSEDVICDLVFDVDWRGALAKRHFNAVDAPPRS